MIVLPNSFPRFLSGLMVSPRQSRMECLSLFLEMPTVMQITAGSDEKQHDLEEGDSVCVSKRISVVLRNVASPESCGSELGRGLEAIR